MIILLIVQNLKKLKVSKKMKKMMFVGKIHIIMKVVFVQLILMPQI